MKYFCGACRSEHEIGGSGFSEGVDVICLNCGGCPRVHDDQYDLLEFHLRQSAIRGLEAKLFDVIISDDSHVPMIGVWYCPVGVSPEERRLIEMITSDTPKVLLTCLGGGPSSASMDGWKKEEMVLLHSHIESNWPNLTSGEVIDVVYLKGGRSQPNGSNTSHHPLTF